jgi:hypothetical protein
MLFFRSQSEKTTYKEHGNYHPAAGLKAFENATAYVQSGDGVLRCIAHTPSP